MKNVNKIIAVAMAITAVTGLAACSNGTTNEAQTTAANTIAPAMNETVEYTPIVSETEPETTVPETETEAETTTARVWDDDAAKREFFNNIYDGLNNAESFELNCKVKGTVPDGKMIDHTYTIDVTKDTMHLISSYRDLNTNDEMVSYEEYQHIDDGVLSTVTKNGDNWVDNTPKEMLRCAMTAKIYNDIPLIGILAENSEDAFQIMYLDRNSPILPTDDGGWTFTQEFSGTQGHLGSNKDFYYHGFAGLIRTPAIKDYFYDGIETLQDGGGDITYTFDKDFRLTNMSFDIIVRNQNAPIDVHVDMTFDKWNEINHIAVPNTTVLETTAAEDAAESTDESAAE